MDSIKVLRGTPITVNDEGETIIMNAEDQRFVERFYRLIDKAEDITKEVQSQEFQKLSDHEQLKTMIERTQIIMAGIDEIFGPESCRKIFGDIVPNPYLISDFFEQLEPIVQRYADNRQKEIAKKYSNERKGARTSKYRNKHKCTRPSKYRTKEEIIQDAMR